MASAKKRKLPATRRRSSRPSWKRRLALSPVTRHLSLLFQRRFSALVNCGVAAWPGGAASRSFFATGKSGFSLSLQPPQTRKHRAIAHDMRRAPALRTKDATATVS